MRAALEETPGVRRVEYSPEQNTFSADYDVGQTDIMAIFAAVFQAGKKMGQEYLPQLVNG